MTEENKSVKNFPNLRFPGFEGGWEAKKLGDVANKIGDGLHGTPDYTDNSDYYFINGNNLVDGKIEIYENTKKVSTSTFFKNNKDLKENTLLISINGTIGSIAKYNNEKVMLGKSVGYFNFYENSDFIYFTLYTKSIQDYFFSELTGSTIKNLSLKTLRDTSIYLPPIEEQSKISYFLSLIESRIQTQKKIIRELNVLKTTVTKRIFSEQLKFKDDGGNDFPKWERKTLGELGEFLGGGTPTSSNSDYWNGNIPWISSSDLFENDIQSINITRFITENAINNSATKLCKAPLILIVSRVGVGKVAYSEKALCTSQDFLNMNNFNCNGIFLTYLLSMEMKKTASSTQGTSIKGISSSDIKSKQILLPCITEQNKIANFFKSIDEKINIETELLAQYENQKKYLLQNLFV